MSKMVAWDDMTPEQQTSARAVRQRRHGSAAGEQRLAVEDARAGAFDEAIVFLVARGFADAAAALNAAAFGGQQQEHSA